MDQCQHTGYELLVVSIHISATDNEGCAAGQFNSALPHPHTHIHTQTEKTDIKIDMQMKREQNVLNQIITSVYD